MRIALFVGAALAVAGLAGTAWAVSQLANGIQEVGQHWWSSAPVALTVLGSVLAATAWRAAAARP